MKFKTTTKLNGKLYKKQFVYYADDTIIRAGSEEDLQKALSAMFNYCNKWKL